jgi:hypothetical protein
MRTSEQRYNIVGCDAGSATPAKAIHFDSRLVEAPSFHDNRITGNAERRRPSVLAFMLDHLKKSATDRPDFYSPGHQEQTRQLEIDTTGYRGQVVHKV